MKLIALSGVPYAGKTTVAKVLVTQGYMHLMYSDLLKHMAVRSLREVGVITSVAEMHQDKPRYRTYLRELGELAGFSTNPRRWIEEVLQPWEYQERPPAVFDNVRTVEQIEILAEFGFELVNVSVPRGIQKSRAVRSGVSYSDFEKLLQQPLEQGFPGYDVIQVSGLHEPELLASILIHL